MSVEIRPATPEDGPAIGAVHVASWRAGYAGLVSAERLAALDPVARGRAWGERIAAGSALRVLVVHGRVVGFVGTQPSRAPDAADGVTELTVLYLEPSAWGRGLGRRLLDRVIAEATAAGAREMTLWTFAGNARALRCYEAAGFGPDGAEKRRAPEGENLLEIRLRRSLTGGREETSRPPRRPPGS